MREYETVFVLDASLESDALEGEIDRVVKLIEEKKGKIHDVQRWGRRRLAYAIDKKADGVYTLVRFDGQNDILDELDRRFALNESMLRHMTVVVDHPDARKVGPGVEPTDARGARDRMPRDDRRRPETGRPPVAPRTEAVAEPRGTTEPQPAETAGADASGETS